MAGPMSTHQDFHQWKMNAIMLFLRVLVQVPSALLRKATKLALELAGGFVSMLQLPAEFFSRLHYCLVDFLIVLR